MKQISIARGFVLGIGMMTVATGMGHLAAEIDENNPELARGYSRLSKLKDDPIPASDLIATTESICRQDRATTAIDSYRAAAILATSEESQTLLLAHDLGMAAAVRGFRPGLRVSLCAEGRLLKKFGIAEIPEPSHESGSSGSTKPQATGPGPSPANAETAR